MRRDKKVIHENDPTPDQNPCSQSLSVAPSSAAPALTGTTGTMQNAVTATVTTHAPTSAPPAGDNVEPMNWTPTVLANALASRTSTSAGAPTLLPVFPSASAPLCPQPATAIAAANPPLFCRCLRQPLTWASASLGKLQWRPVEAIPRRLPPWTLLQTKCLAKLSPASWLNVSYFHQWPASA